MALVNEKHFIRKMKPNSLDSFSIEKYAFIHVIVPYSEWFVSLDRPLG